MAPGSTLVTGATGFVGSHLLERLAGGAPLVGWYRPAGRPPAGATGVDWQPVNILDRARVQAAVADSGVTRIYHLAGAPHVGASWQTVVAHLEINALGTHYLLEAVRALDRPCRVLVVTSAQIYQAGDEPISENTPCVRRPRTASTSPSRGRSITPGPGRAPSTSSPASPDKSRGSKRA